MRLGVRASGATISTAWRAKSLVDVALVWQNHVVPKSSDGAAKSVVIGIISAVYTEDNEALGLKLQLLQRWVELSLEAKYLLVSEGPPDRPESESCQHAGKVWNPRD
jgi:hypothetical protein